MRKQLYWVSVSASGMSLQPHLSVKSRRSCIISLLWSVYQYLWSLVAHLLGGALHDESLVDVWDDTTTSNSSLDEGIELFVSSNSQLEMSWGDSLDLQVLGSVTCELQDLSGEVLEDSSTVDCWSSSDSAVGRDSALEESVDSSDWELNSKSNVIRNVHIKRPEDLNGYYWYWSELAGLSSTGAVARVLPLYEYKNLPEVQLWLILTEVLSLTFRLRTCLLCRLYRLFLTEL